MFRKQLQPIPETREGFRSNELPICQRDIRALAQVHGEELAEAARFTAQLIRINKGVNPNTIAAVFPEGRNGPLDEAELLRVITSLAIWTEIETGHGTILAE